MYSTASCPFCIRAERLLRARGVADIAKIRVDLEPARRGEMMERTGRRTVPQIYIGERHVGGYDDLVALDRAGELRAAAAPREPAGRRGEPALRYNRRVYHRRGTSHGDRTPTAAQPTPSLSIEKIYVKDLSLENPGAPQSFTDARAPQVEVGLRTRGEQIEANVYECVLTITVTAQDGGQDAVPGRGRAGGHLPHPRRAARPTAAADGRSTARPCCFPYVRETIADAITRAGFPPVHLAPINFEALYQQQLANMQQQAPAAVAN